MVTRARSTAKSGTPIPAVLKRMISIIAKGFDPDRIILFGSRARGTARPDSDYDLLVVMPDGGSKRARQMEIRLALAGIHAPKDILVTTPEEFAWRKDVPGTIERPAMLEGKILYARA